MKILFMGTPDFAATALEAIAESGTGTVVGVVTRTDMPKDRGHKLLPPPVKVKAEELGFPVFQPETLKDNAFLDELKSLNPDIIVVAAYGKILPGYILDYPKYGCVNIHGSLLPKYRGAAPIQRAIMAGDKEIGITIMNMERGLDTGNMYLKGSVRFEDESFGEIHDALAELGGKLIVEYLNTVKTDGVPEGEKQDDSLSDYAEKITKEDCIIDFDADAESINNKIRALSPAPCAICSLCGKKVKITKSRVFPPVSEGTNGEILAVSGKGDGYIDIKTGNGVLRVLRLVPEGKKEMSAGDFVRGRGAAEGGIFEKITL